MTWLLCLHTHSKVRTGKLTYVEQGAIFGSTSCEVLLRILGSQLFSSPQHHGGQDNTRPLLVLSMASKFIYSSWDAYFDGKTVLEYIKPSLVSLADYKKTLTALVAFMSPQQQQGTREGLGYSLLNLTRSLMQSTQLAFEGHSSTLHLVAISALCTCLRVLRETAVCINLCMSKVPNSCTEAASLLSSSLDCLFPTASTVLPINIILDSISDYAQEIDESELHIVPFTHSFLSSDTNNSNSRAWSCVTLCVRTMTDLCITLALEKKISPSFSAPAQASISKTPYGDILRHSTQTIPMMSHRSSFQSASNLWIRLCTCIGSFPSVNQGCVDVCISVYMFSQVYKIVDSFDSCAESLMEDIDNFA